MTKQEVTKRLPVKRTQDEKKIYRCAVIATLKLFATKWKPCILCYLAETPMRYNDLYRIIHNISRKMLSEHLNELENAGLVVRTQHDAKLQRVDYSLSEKGRSLLPLIYQLQDWGMQHIDNVLSIKQMINVTMN
ncbi:MAG TPA: helix-turn-helix domain-containing protein [Chitinophagaceae bacterium]|nr:helix-turn-helix domain-containing protein [Chitinophagaceae bacterium]